jgi:ParB-like chromosome segregation protein Spo0J
MAVSFANDTTKRTSTLVADYPENIQIDPELTGRASYTDADLESLAADIEANGQRTPVKIRKDDAGQPLLVFGSRRLGAIALINKRRAKAGEPLLKVECSYETLTPEQAFAAAIAENRFRKDATPMDDCHNINVWLNRFKKSVEEIARIYFPEAKGKDEAAAALKWVKDRAGLVELADEAQAGVRKGEIKITAAVQLTRLSKDQQKQVVAESKSNLKGAKRIKVAEVIAAKTGKAAPVGKKAAAKAAPAPAAKAAPKVTGSVYEAAEALASAVDAWLNDATGKAEEKLVKAHQHYRALVPAQKGAA